MRTDTSQRLRILLFRMSSGYIYPGFQPVFYSNSPGEKSYKVAGPGRVEEGLNAPDISLEHLELHAAADAQNLVDLDLAARPSKTRKSSHRGFAVSS